MQQWWFTWRSFSSRRNGDAPLSYMNSKAKNYRLRDTMMVDEKMLSRQRYSIPLGVSIFGLLMYFFYWRDYGEDAKQKEILEQKRRELVDYITADVKENVEEDK